MHFIVPALTDKNLDSLTSSKIDFDYPYWLGGPINWVVQSYLVLRQYREGLSISTQPIRNKINLAHVTTWRRLPRQKHEYRVSIRADYRRLFDVDFEVLQNPVAVQSPKQIYLTYWPLPRLKPRDTSRQNIQNVAYAGRIGKRNIATILKNARGAGEFGGLHFRIVDKEHWHDMREIDVLLAIRDFSLHTYNDKPPSKLINAWHAGIPLIAGYDSAFSSIGTPGVDYIRVKTEVELSKALEQLRDDPQFYSRIVEAGKIKAREYTWEKIAEQWLAALDGPIREDWECANTGGLLCQLSRFRNRVIDQIFDIASVAIANIKKNQIHHA